MKEDNPGPKHSREIIICARRGRESILYFYFTKFLYLFEENKNLLSDPIACAIKQSLFSQGVIGEEGEDGETSVYDIQLEVEELHELDDDFSEMNCSGESDEESPAKTIAKSAVAGLAGTLGTGL